MRGCLTAYVIGRGEATIEEERMTTDDERTIAGVLRRSGYLPPDTLKDEGFDLSSGDDKKMLRDFLISGTLDAKVTDPIDRAACHRYADRWPNERAWDIRALVLAQPLGDLDRSRRLYPVHAALGEAEALRDRLHRQPFRP
jgi:hypothetical protein